MASDSITITDNRTGKTYEAQVKDGAIKAIDLRQIKVAEDDFGLMSYDPSYSNTASCVSRITYIDGDAGILEYRGYPIEQLAERCGFLESAYLILFGELPTQQELSEWQAEVMAESMIPEEIPRLIQTFRYDAHPMAMLASAFAALSAHYPDAKKVGEAKIRRKHIVKLIAMAPTLAACAYRHRRSLPFVGPDDSRGYVENFLQMLWRKMEARCEVNRVLTKALEILFILHLDHEQNCSSTAMRTIGSAKADPYVSMAGAAGALYGPLHGGANEAVLRMLHEIEKVEAIPEYMESVKRGDRRLMGFGHRVYKNYDPRARIIKQVASEVFAEIGKNPLVDVAKELEKIALEDDYFVSRRLYPNVDFYSGVIYEAMGFKPEFFTVLFAIPRVAGWLAQWDELCEDSSQKIARPRQIYLGERSREVTPIDQRQPVAAT